jgi:hypothetical protein
MACSVSPAELETSRGKIIPVNMRRFKELLASAQRWMARRAAFHYSEEASAEELRDKASRHSSAICGASRVWMGNPGRAIRPGAAWIYRASRRREVLERGAASHERNRNYSFRRSHRTASKSYRLRPSCPVESPCDPA